VNTGLPRVPALPADRPAFGTWLKLPTPEVIEVLAATGLDFVVIDLEHTLLSLDTVSSMIALGRLLHVVPLVRVPDHQPSMIGRVLDAGAAGVVVPGVETEAQARALVQSVRFPPHGRRGLSTSGRAGGWGAQDPGDYMATDTRAVLVVQLESAAALDAAERIAAVDGVSAVFVGPMDLAASLGLVPGSPELDDVLAKMEARALPDGVLLATAAGTDPQRAAGLIARGYRMVVLGTDAAILREATTALVAELSRRTRQETR
jgi:2-keto-3-deoxy-L-rhamnonate aldolase RhmA